MTKIFRVLVASLAVSAIGCSSEAPTTDTKEAAVKTPPTSTTAPAPIATTPTPVATGTAPTPAPTGTTPPPGGVCAPQANDPCELCVVQKCCAQIQAFESDPQKPSYIQCFAQCESVPEQQYEQCLQQKLQQCVAAAPSAAQKDQAIGTCAQQNCAAQCQG